MNRSQPGSAAAESARRAGRALQAVDALVGAECDASRTDREALVQDTLAALEAARTARRYTTHSIELLMQILADAGVPWPTLGISGPGDE